MFKERRTIRFFKETKIDRALLEEIGGYGIYAPTHNFGLRAVVADDPEIIGLADRVIKKFVSKLYNLFFRSKIVANIMRRMPSPLRSEYIKAKSKLDFALTAGKAFRNRPAAMIFLVGDKRILLSVESAQYSLYNISLYAQTRGIGSRNLVGNQMILNRSMEIRNRLRLCRHERIFGTIGVGYPAVKFRNKVTGRELKIQWNSG
ncbi:MAG TPA: nitroreductase family protein [Spirochaetia bacterium]|nr:nitroreductase family protein [Spirochaetia bacterium]